jgi:hypothetical protein
LKLGALPALVSPRGAAFVAKLDAAGTPLWARLTKGDSVHVISGLAIDPEGRVAVAGHFEGTLSFGGDKLTNPGGKRDDGMPLKRQVPVPTTLFIAEFDRAGKLLHSRVLGDDSPKPASNGSRSRSVTFDTAGRIIVSGEFDGWLASGDEAAVQSLGGLDGFVAAICP